MAVHVHPSLVHACANYARTNARAYNKWANPHPNHSRPGRDACTSNALSTNTGSTDSSANNASTPNPGTSADTSPANTVPDVCGGVCRRAVFSPWDIDHVYSDWNNTF
jgi:hypothetical protein